MERTRLIFVCSEKEITAFPQQSETDCTVALLRQYHPIALLVLYGLPFMAREGESKSSRLFRLNVSPLSSLLFVRVY